MPSYSTPIAEAVVSLLSGITPLGCPVEFRRTDSLVSRETIPRVIVTNAQETQLDRGTFGAEGDVDSFGTVEKAYPIQIAIYESNQGELQGNDVNPAFILRAKQLLNKPYLTAVPAVFDTDLLQNWEWENQPFRDGGQVSRFGLLFYTAEPRNG